MTKKNDDPVSREDYSIREQLARMSISGPLKMMIGMSRVEQGYDLYESKYLSDSEEIKIKRLTLWFLANVEMSDEEVGQLLRELFKIEE